MNDPLIVLDHMELYIDSGLNPDSGPFYVT